MREVRLPILSDASCLISPYSIDPNVQVCAGIRGKDTCQGDSGGPLVVKADNGPNRGTWTLSRSTPMVRTIVPYLPRGA